MDKFANLRSRVMRLLLYPDNPKHVEILEKIKSFDYYAYILHDKDSVEDDVVNEELKKPHWHVVLKFVNPRYTHAIADDLGLEYRFIIPSGSLKKSLLYLIHFNSGDYKHEYDLEEVHGTLFSSLEKYCRNESDIEDERVLNIVELINSYNCYISFGTLLKDICDKGLYGDYRRGFSIFKELVFEHNKHYLTFNLFENKEEDV